MVTKAAKAKGRARLDAANLELTSEVSDAPGALGGGGISSDHPLAVAFERSYDAGHEVSFDVNDPVLAQKLLQKLANKSGRSLRKSVAGKTITILVGDKKPRARKVETASDEGLSE